MKTSAVRVVLIMLASGLLLTGLGGDAGDTPIPVAVEPAFADSAEDDTNHPPNITVQTKNDLGTFGNVTDTFTTHTYIDTEWRVILEDPDGDVVSVHWNFTDGFTSTSIYVNHSYKDPDEYLLKIEAFDGNETNGRVKKTILVIVEPNVEPVCVIDITAPAIEWVTPPVDSPRYRGLEARINLGDNIVFDASNSYDPDGHQITSFEWEFDDIYATEDNPNVATLARAGHKFLVEGEYNVTLTLFDGVKYGYLNVWILTNTAPIAVPPAQIKSETNREITFDGSRSEDPDSEDKLQYKWDFGDNTRTEWSVSSFATHTYKITATYTITLWVTDGLLYDSATTTASINPQNHPPVAVASIQEDDLWTNMSLHFSSTGSYDIDGMGRISFTWDFDDGTSPSTLANPIHMYEDPGTYNVRLTVYDANNVSTSDDLVLKVQRNYGDTDIVIKAVDPTTQKTFYDPAQGDLQQVAVMRDGWVAYLCDLRADQEIIVKITIIGDRPADIYLFEEVHFYTYKRNPQVTFVPFRADGFKHNATGVFDYSFTASETDRYYIVIDNKDWPLGTDTEGPVDYNISIDPNYPPMVANGEILEDPDDLWTNMSIHFSINGSYDIDDEGSISFTWDFGDGTDPSTLENPIHVYEEPGTYTVTLTVIDQYNVSAQDTLIITILSIDPKLEIEDDNWTDALLVVFVAIAAIAMVCVWAVFYRHREK